MEIVRDLHQYQGDAEHALAIGTFDGVHLGHRAVIGQTQEVADRLGVGNAVVTFDRHPAYVLRPSSAPKLLTDLDQKLELLDDCGVDTVVVVPFDAERAKETADAFVERVVVGCLRARAVVVGVDFHFGRDRAGNVDLLSKLGQAHGFEVVGIDLLPRTEQTTEQPTGQPGQATESISSTAIRRALAGGEVTTAEAMLGRHHELRGPVVSGDRRGGSIGFPTANVAIDDAMALPADAVYAGWYVRPDGTRWPAAINIGKRPTFHANADRSLLEAHLIGFDGDLYGELARVQFVELLRSEQRFDGVEALVRQLRLDVARATEILGA